MKHLRKFRFLFFFILTLPIVALAQPGKPQYNIRCERAGVFIGNIKIELFPLIAPLHVANFDSLVSIHFYDTTAFHRVVPNFVIQGGDPNSRHGDPSTWGFGDPTQTTVPAEFSNVDHARGILGAARDQNINSATSQFFINVVRNSGLNGNYTVYGKVYEGINLVDTIVNSPTVPGTERPIQKIEMFITEIGVNNSAPTIPILIFPANGASHVYSTANFTWNAVSDALLYRMQIAKDSLFQNLIYNNTFGTNLGNIGVNLEQGLVKHYWRVKANNGAFESEYSPAFNFTTGISRPQLLNPPDSAVDVSTSPILQWTSVTNAVKYKLQVATSSSFLFSSIILNDTNVTFHSYQLNNLLNNKTYYWRVAASTSSYSTDYTPKRQFKTVSATDIREEKSPLVFSLDQNYPNPFNPSTKIKYTIPTSPPTPLIEERGGSQMQFVSLKIYDILGNEVATLVNEEKEPGVYEVEFSNVETGFIPSPPSGIYFYQLRTGHFIETRKMILLR